MFSVLYFHFFSLASQHALRIGRKPPYFADSGSQSFRDRPLGGAGRRGGSFEVYADDSAPGGVVFKHTNLDEDDSVTTFTRQKTNHYFNGGEDESSGSGGNIFHLSIFISGFCWQSKE